MSPIANFHVIGGCSIFRKKAKFPLPTPYILMKCVKWCWLAGWHWKNDKLWPLSDLLAHNNSSAYIGAITQQVGFLTLRFLCELVGKNKKRRLYHLPTLWWTNWRKRRQAKVISSMPERCLAAQFQWLQRSRAQALHMHSFVPWWLQF